MNERIQALLHQCSVPDDQAEEYSKSKGLVIPDQKLDVAKFAQLIVHQMLDITDAHTEVFQTDRDKALIEHIKQSVKQHFGVEE